MSNEALPPPCPYCGGSATRSLGPIGAWHWYRCSDCNEAFTLEPRDEPTTDGEPT